MIRGLSVEYFKLAALQEILREGNDPYALTNSLEYGELTLLESRARQMKADFLKNPIK